MTISTFRVAAMDCPSEEQLIKMKLADLDGVDRVAVDLDTRQVTVEHDLDPSLVTAALQTLELGTTHLDDLGEITGVGDPRRERHALWIALAINSGFFIGEMAAGIISGSMGLVADALDMGADASVYALSLVAVAATAARKRQLARFSAYMQFGLAAAGLLEVTRRAVAATGLPETRSMIVMSLLALGGNFVTLLVLRGVLSGEPHIQASWIFTSNDIKVNMLVIAAAIGVLITDSAAPDLIAGGLIFLVVANGARRILKISR
jgi:Co/Zn/Cd efflux system component